MASFTHKTSGLIIALCCSILQLEYVHVSSFSLFPIPTKTTTTTTTTRTHPFPKTTTPFGSSTTTITTSTTTQTRTSHGMFTGIVEEMGSVIKLEERSDMTLWDGTIGSGTELTVKGQIVMEGAYLGCSICVSGVCLTATELDSQKSLFKVGLAPETLRRTYLGQLQPGDAVNLERASEIGGRNSGHFVQGHIDGMGTIIDRWMDEDSLFFKVQVPPHLAQYIVPKGFIAIDGTSLTICEVDCTNTDQMWFTFMLVEYTQKKIIIPAKQVGDQLNIEVDVLGKYAQSALAAFVPRIEQLEAKVKDLETKLANSQS